MKRENLLNSCLNDDNNLFKEIKKARCRKTNPSSTIDGVTDDILGYLAERYKNNVTV